MAENTHIEEARRFAARSHELFIGGEWVEPSTTRRLSTVDPSTGRQLSEVSIAGPEELDRAVLVARAAVDGGAWSRLMPAERQNMLWRLADLMDARSELLAALESLDTGKPIRDARFFDVPQAVATTRYYAGWATKLNGETIDVSRPGAWHSYTVREPVGVVAAIVPWNAPLMLTMSKVAPALAAGCAVILKPAEHTPLTALYLAELAQEAGIPSGALSVLTGDGEELGRDLVAHPGVDKVSFTGSAEVGRLIVQSASKDFKRVSLELGGKSPMIILPDADLDLAILAAAQGIFANAGQVCNAGSRLFAHRDVFDQVVDGVADFAGKLKIGAGLQDDTQLGPVISQTQLDRVAGYVDLGVREGASVRTGGNVIEGDGYFMEPTILTGTTSQMRVTREEIFGPVLCAMATTDDDLDQIVREANETSYGLGAYVWTKDLAVAHRLARRLKVGTVRVNGGGLDPALPFGGYKQSGWGRESGREGIEAYTEMKSVTVSLGEL